MNYLLITGSRASRGELRLLPQRGVLACPNVIEMAWIFLKSPFFYAMLPIKQLNGISTNTMEFPNVHTTMKGRENALLKKNVLIIIPYHKEKTTILSCYGCRNPHMKPMKMKDIGKLYRPWQNYESGAFEISSLTFWKTHCWNLFTRKADEKG